MTSATLIVRTPPKQRTVTQGGTFLRWLMAWVAAPAIGVANGAARDALYQERLGATAAHYVSTAMLLIMLGIYMRVLARFRPIPTLRSSLLIGVAWAILTIAFEFGFGHYVAGDSWAKLLEQYDVTTGKIWILVPIWMALGPSVLGRVPNSTRGDPDVRQPVRD